jgi:hypothetical protein
MLQTRPGVQAGDPCPQCGGQFVEHRAPTDAEARAAADPEKRQPLPFRVDTADAATRDELGALHECETCHYRSRFKSAAAADDAASSSRGSRSRRPASGSSGE